MPAAKTVNLDTVDYDQAGNIVFGGHGPAGSKVQIYVDNSAYGLATIGSDGTWSLPGLAPLAVGAHELRADEIGPDGAVKSRVGMPFYREDPTKVATAVPAVIPAQPTVVATATEAEPAKPADAVKTAEAPATDTVTTTTVTEAAKAPEPVVAPATTAAEAPKTAETTVAATPEAPAATTTEAPKAVEAPAETPAATPPAAPANIIIQPGNNLWKLSRQIYGKGVMYTVIYEANKAQIRDADLIYPGQVFITPDAPKGQ